jgi:hypothetical protein
MQYSCTKGDYCVQTPEEMMNFRWTFSLPKFLKNLLFNGDKSWTLSFLFSSGLNFHFDMYFICWFYWKIPLWSKCQATKSSEFALSGILIITERPTGRKCCSISWRFHDIKVSLINSETLPPHSRLYVMMGSLGNHGSSQIFTQDPSPILHITHSLETLSPLRMLLQT